MSLEALNNALKGLYIILTTSKNSYNVTNHGVETQISRLDLIIAFIRGFEKYIKTDEGKENWKLIFKNRCKAKDGQFVICDKKETDPYDRLLQKIYRDSREENLRIIFAYMFAWCQQPEETANVLFEGLNPVNGIFSKNCKSDLDLFVDEIICVILEITDNGKKIQNEQKVLVFFYAMMCINQNINKNIAKIPGYCNNEENTVAAKCIAKLNTPTLKRYLEAAGLHTIANIDLDEYQDTEKIPPLLFPEVKTEPLDGIELPVCLERVNTPPMMNTIKAEYLVEQYAAQGANLESVSSISIVNQNEQYEERDTKTPPMNNTIKTEYLVEQCAAPGINLESVSSISMVNQNEENHLSTSNREDNTLPDSTSQAVFKTPRRPRKRKCVYTPEEPNTQLKQAALQSPDQERRKSKREKCELKVGYR